MSDTNELLAQILSEVQNLHAKIDLLVNNSKPLPSGANIFIATIHNMKINDHVGTLYSYDIYGRNGKKISNDGFLRKQGDEASLIVLELALDAMTLHPVSELHINMSLSNMLNKEDLNKAVRNKLSKFKEFTVNLLNINSTPGTLTWTRVCNLMMQYQQQSEEKTNNVNG